MFFDVARIVGVFQDDDHPETVAVGITSEDGEDLLLQVDDPATIIEMAQRLMMFASEIHANRNVKTNQVIAQLQALGPGATMQDLANHNKRLQDAGVISLDSKRGVGGRHESH